MARSSVPGNSKYAMAVQIAGAIAFASLDQTNPVGLMALGSRAMHCPADQSRRSVLAWLQQLRRGDFTEQTEIGPRIHQLAARLQNTACFIVLSDLHDPSGNLALQTLAQRHDVALIRLMDPVENHVPLRGIFRAREAETHTEYVSTSRGKRAYCHSIEVLTRAGISSLCLTVGDPFVASLRHFLAQRTQRRKNLP
jgi:uncharacterized protein (DUF58 family)